MRFLHKICCLTLILSTNLLSCKKDNGNEEEVILTKEEILTDKIEDVIPDKYLDSLKKWGLLINPGTTPPNLLGTFQVKPISLKKSSLPNEKPGKTFVDAMFQVKNQNNDTYTIDFYGRNFLANRDTYLPPYQVREINLQFMVK